MPVDEAGSKGTKYPLAVGVAAATSILLIWVNAAVGIIGDGPVNLLYLGVPVVGVVGAIMAGFRAYGTALALFATALAQLLVPLVALVLLTAGRPDLDFNATSTGIQFEPGIAPVVGLNALFAILWIVSGGLFWHAAGDGP